MNMLLAALLAYFGDKLGVDLYLAVVVALGIRIFNNLGRFAGHSLVTMRVEAGRSRVARTVGVADNERGLMAGPETLLGLDIGTTKVAAVIGGRCGRGEDPRRGLRSVARGCVAAPSSTSPRPRAPSRRPSPRPSAWPASRSNRPGWA